jgi:chemotaxis protein histidine kinase CheA
MKVKTITCPNCGHSNNFLAEDCSQCGIIFSKYYEELEKAEALRRHIEEQEKAEELKRQQEEEARAEEERLRKEEEEKAEALRKQQKEEERQAEELKRQQEEEARAEEKRLRKEEEEKAQEERDQAAANMTAPVQMPVSTPDFRPAETLQARLSPYMGQMIGVSYGNPSEIQNVKLISLNTDHFQIYYPISKHVVSYAYRQLMLVTENPEGISAVGPDISPVFPVVIEVLRPFFHKS